MVLALNRNVMLALITTGRVDYRPAGTPPLGDFLATRLAVRRFLTTCAAFLLPL